MQTRGMTTVRTLGIVFLVLAAAIVASVHANAAKGSHPQEAGANTAGEISGSIYFKGEKPRLQAIDMSSDAVCASLHDTPVYTQDGEVNSNGTLPNVFVYIKSGIEGTSTPTPRNSVVLTQEGCMYQPHVAVVMAGQPFQVVTLDPTTHNVHAMPKINREWNVTQQPGSPSIIKVFSQPEMAIPVHCNVHPWMSAYINVVSNPFYSVTGANGTFVIKNVPAGDYTLEAWTATFGTQEQHVTVRREGTSTVDFTFGAH
jgi:plastocyanin